VTADDKYDICETVYRFAHGVDTRDWALYRSIFADEVRVDYSSYGAFAPTVQSADAWVAGDEEWSYAASDNDRIDLLPERKRYEPGETARLQVRTPFNYYVVKSRS